MAYTKSQLTDAERAIAHGNMGYPIGRFYEVPMTGGSTYLAVTGFHGGMYCADAITRSATKVTYETRYEFSPTLFRMSVMEIEMKDFNQALDYVILQIKVGRKRGNEQETGAFSWFAEE